MAKQGMFAVIVAGCFGAGVAQAGGLPAAAVDRIAASPYAAGVASYGVPPEFSLLLGLLLLALLLPCVAALLWMIRSDLKQSRPAATRTVRRIEAGSKHPHPIAPADAVIDVLLL